MNRFEWASPQTLAQALEMRPATTATSMLSSDGQPPPGAAILKAGGIDLLGLMKDGLLQPARIVNLQAIAELGQIIQQTDGTMRVGANVTLAQIASDQRPAHALSRARRRGRKLGKSAAAPGCDDRWQSAAAAALLVFPFGASSLRAQGRRHVLRLCAAKTNTTRSSGRKGAPSCTRRPPPPRWWRSPRRWSWRAATAPAASLPSKRSSLRLQPTSDARTTFAAARSLPQSCCRPRARAYARCTCAGRTGVLRLADRRCCGRARQRRGWPVPFGIGRSRRRSTGTLSGQGSGGGIDRKAGFRRDGPARRPGGADRRHTAGQKRLQGARFRSAGKTRDHRCSGAPMTPLSRVTRITDKFQDAPGTDVAFGDKRTMSRRQANAALLAGAALAAMPAFALAAQEAMTLPAPRTGGGMPLMQALQQRRSTREFAPRPLPSQVLSDLLWAAYGINRPSGDRTAPYWRHIMVIDVYAAMADGVWLYEPKQHVLLPHLAQDIRAQTGQQDFAATAPLDLVYVAHGERMQDVPRQSADSTPRSIPASSARTCICSARQRAWRRFFAEGSITSNLPPRCDWMAQRS